MSEDSPCVLEVIEDSEGRHRIQWYFPEEDDWGALLGEDREVVSEEKLATSSGGDWDHFAVLHALQVGATHDGQDRDGFFWTSEKAAKAACKAAKTFVRAKRGEKPWPGWAIQAKAAGWSPPDGWVP